MAKKPVKIRITDPRIGTEFPLPAYGTSGSAGIDLRAMIEEDSFELQPGEVRLISTGIAFYLENPDYAGLLLPRSGLGHKHGVILGNSVGLLDADYQNTLFVSCWNRSNAPFQIARGERIAQLVVVPVVQMELEVVESFTATDRGELGFGSTGKK